MCTAATYKTKGFYFGRTLDYEFSYGEEITITPRNYPIPFRHMDTLVSHYAIIGMAHVADNYPLYYDAMNEKGVGYSNIWPLFGSANQLLSALVLITLCVFLKVTGRQNKTLIVPCVIMLCVTFTALVQRTLALVNAFSAGTAVFMVEGLQLIVAILLMVLGVIIVVTSGKELLNKKAGSEVRE